MAKTAGKDQLKLYVLVGVLGVALLWITYYGMRTFSGPGRARELDTKGWRVAKEINAHLVELAGFKDTGVDVTIESPLTMKVVGVVHTDSGVDELKTLLTEKWPNVTFEFEVMILK